MTNELQTPGSFPLIEKLGLPLFTKNWSAMTDQDQLLFASDVEHLLRNNKREATDFGYPATDEIVVLKMSKKLEPITKDELLALMNDFYLPQSGFTEPDIKMLKMRLESAGVKHD